VVYKIVKLIEAKTGMIIPRDWGENEMRSCFNGYKVCVLQDEMVLEICCTT
jgi:hypothetical protein